MTEKNSSIQGPFSISGNLTVGGNSTTRGNAKFEHNLEVKGWLKARNIVGTCKGFFASETKLNSCYPKPENGWWALVGNTLPAEIYRAEGKKWIDTGEQGGEIVPYLDELEETVLENKNNITSLQENKQNNLTFDNTPTEGSNNPVTSGGVKSYVEKKEYINGVVMNGYVPNDPIEGFIKKMSTSDYLVYIQSVTPGEKIIIYTDALYNNTAESLAAFTNADDPLQSDATKLGSNISMQVGYNTITVPESATYIAVTLKFSSSIGDPNGKIVAKFSDYAIIEKIKELESGYTQFTKNLSEEIKLRYINGVVMYGYVPNDPNNNFITKRDSSDYLVYIQSVTPGEKIIIYTDKIYNDTDSLASFTDADDPLQSDAKKINNNIKLKVGYNTITVPENATYIAVTIKFSDDIGDPNGKIVAKFSDYAITEKIKSLESICESLFNKLQNNLVLRLQNDTIFISSEWSKTEDLVKQITYDNTEKNKNINFVQTYISEKGSIEINRVVKVCGDDICPIFVNNSYIGGNHGWNAAKQVTFSNHGKTIRDVGSIYTDNDGTKFYLLSVIDNNNLVIISENKSGSNSDYKFVYPNGNLTYQSNGDNTSNIDCSSIKNYANLYGCVTPSDKTIMVDGKTVTEDGDYGCKKASLVEHYDIIDLLSIINQIVNNRPSEGYETIPPYYQIEGVEKLCGITLSYVYDGNNTIVNTTVTSYKDCTLSFIGYIQAQAMTDGAKLYIPKVLPISTSEGTSYDFRKITDWEESPSEALTFTPQYWEDGNNPPDRAIMINNQAVLSLGYITDMGIYKENARKDLVSDYAIQLSTARKLYPMGYCKKQLISKDSSYSAIAYRSYYNSYNRPSERTNLSIISNGNATYIYVDYHGAIDDFIDIQQDWLGKSIEIIDKNDRCNVFGNVVSGKICIKSTASADNYGFIVLKLV